LLQSTLRIPVIVCQRDAHTLPNVPTDLGEQGNVRKSSVAIVVVEDIGKAVINRRKAGKSLSRLSADFVAFYRPV
jgi:hypothetical protein